MDMELHISAAELKKQLSGTKLEMQEDWHDFIQNLEVILDAAGVWGQASGAVKHPAEVEDDKEDTEKAKRDIWDSQDKQFKAGIVAIVSGGAKLMVNFQTDTFPAMIVKWKAAFEPVLIGDTAAHLEKLGGLQIGEESVSEFIAIFQKALYDVKQQGITLDGSVVTSFFLNGIRSAFPGLYGIIFYTLIIPALRCYSML